MKTLFLIIVIVIQSCFTLQASSCVSIKSGDWEEPASWSCGHVPVCGDTIIIAAGHIITMTTQQDYYTYCTKPMYINVLGTYIIQTGKKIMLPVGSVVEVQVGGLLTPSGGGGGSSNLIDIGGINVWSAGDGKVDGYAIFKIDPLPIELLKFEVEAKDNTIDIKWKTASEKNNDYFTVEKTRDGIRFETVSSVKGAGNSIIISNYNLKDYHPYDGHSYYRLSQTDYNGTVTHYNLVNANFKRKTDFLFKIYPNPNDGVCINLDMIADKGKETHLVMTDIYGKEIYSKEIIINSNEENVYTFCSEERLSAGIYLVTVSSSNKEYTKKVVVE